MAQRNIPTPNITQFELWANKYETNLNIYLQNDFRENNLDINKPIDFDIFSKWLLKDHNLYLNYADKSIVIATNLMGLDEVGFNDSGSSNSSNNNADNYSYPSF